jgi:CRP/FNR family transcriptional regulator, cyclic AMP receptor protein
MTLAAVPMPPERASLVALDPGLAELLTPDRHHAAAALRVHVRNSARGTLDVSAMQASPASNIGLLILDGIVTREVLLGSTVSAELLGPGDIVRPWSFAGGEELLSTKVRWSVVSDYLRAAVLDRRVAAELGAFPEISVVLMDRLNNRSSRLAVTQAISQLQRVDRRLIALFTHLAERWGRITPGGVLVPLRLSHRMLGGLVGASRPTVSTAIGMLTRTGELVRRPDGAWLLAGLPTPATAPEVRRVEPRRAVSMRMHRPFGAASDFGERRASAP